MMPQSIKQPIRELRLRESRQGKVARGTFLLFVLAILLAITAQPLFAQEKSLIWDRFDVDIVVKKDGSFDVSEHQTIHFTSGTFTKGSRSIPKNKFDALDNFSVTDASGNVYQQATDGTEPFTFTVAENYNNYTIYWYFPATSGSTETYTLNYSVIGGLRIYDGGDQLWWKAVYADRPFPVRASRVRVIVPDGAPIQEWSAYINEVDARDSATAEVLDGNQAVIFNVGRLAVGEDFEVRVQFQHGSVDAVTPGWQAQADADAAARDAREAELAKLRPIYNLGLGVLGLLCLFGGPLGLYLLWYNLGRDKPVPMVADYLPAARDDLAPGVAGALLDASVDMEDVLASVVDLARLKSFSITESKDDSWFRGRSDFIYWF